MSSAGAASIVQRMQQQSRSVNSLTALDRIRRPPGTAHTGVSKLEGYRSPNGCLDSSTDASGVVHVLSLHTLRFSTLRRFSTPESSHWIRPIGRESVDIPEGNVCGPMEICNACPSVTQIVRFDTNRTVMNGVFVQAQLHLARII